MDYSVLFSTLYLAGGLLIFFMGFVILRENPGSPVNRATSLMLFSGSLGSILGALGQLLDVSSGAADSAAAYAGYVHTFSYLWEFFFPSLLYFALVFPVQQPIVGRRHVVEILIFVPHLLHLLLVLVLNEVGRFTQPMDLLLERLGTSGLGNVVGTILELVNVLVALMNKLHQQTFSLVNIVYAEVAMAMLFVNRRRVASTRVRDQLTIVLIGLTVCVAAYVVAVLLPVVAPFADWGQVEVVLIGIGLLVASVSLAYAIVRHKFLDMQSLARRSILLGGVALGFAFVYLVVIKQIARFSAGVFGSNSQVIEAGFLVLAIILFQPVINGLEDAVESLLDRRDRNGRDAVLGSLSRQLGAEVDLRGMRDRLADSLGRSLQVDAVRLYTLEGAAQGDVLDGGNGERIPVGQDAALAHLLHQLESSPQPILRHDLRRMLHGGGAGEARTPEWALRYELFVPLVHQQRVRGLLALGPKSTGGRFHAEDLALLTLLAQQVSTSLENVRLLSENVQKRILEEEIHLASGIQEKLLPKRLPECPGYCSHAFSLPSKFVGGDYFDLFTPDGRHVHIAIADVSGKGVAAALLMSSLRAALHSTVRHVDSPARILELMNDLLYDSTSPEKFATFFYGILDTAEHRLTYANAGHNYPLVVSPQGDLRALEEGGLLLGAFRGADYRNDVTELRGGETLFLYTDGITEATDGSEADFGEERLAALLRRLGTRPPQEVLAGVLDAVRTFTGGAEPSDDVTMVAVQRQGANGRQPGAGRT